MNILLQKYLRVKGGKKHEKDRDLQQQGRRWKDHDMFLPGRGLCPNGQESPGTNVEALKDLVGDNTGPLTEPYNLDKG